MFVFVVQYFASDKEYGRRDVDNMAKTILDVLKNRFYRDDSQVKTLLVGKKLEKRVPQDFAYVAIKRLGSSQDVDALKIVSEGINAFRKDTTGVLLITHYNRILQYVKPDFVHIMRDGKIIKSGGEELARRVEETGYKDI